MQYARLCQAVAKAMLTPEKLNVTLLDRVVEANPHRSESELPLQTRYQSVVQSPRPLLLRYCAYGAYNALVFEAIDRGPSSGSRG